MLQIILLTAETALVTTVKHFCNIKQLHTKLHEPAKTVHLQNVLSDESGNAY